MPYPSVQGAIGLLIDYYDALADIKEWYYRL